MSRVAGRPNRIPSLEALIREQMSLRDAGRDPGHGETMSFGRQDSCKVVSGSFAVLVGFLRQVGEAESFRRCMPPAEDRPDAGPWPRDAGVGEGAVP